MRTCTVSLTLRKTLERKLGRAEEVTGKAGELEFNCPFCRRKGDPDPSHHLGVSLAKLVYHCFRCGAGGRLSELVPAAALGQESGRPSTRDAFCPRASQRASQSSTRVAGAAALLRDLPARVPGYVGCDVRPDELQAVEEIYNHRTVLAYAQSRGVDVQKFPCGSSAQGGLEFRLIFPVTQEGKLVYYQARAVKAYMQPKMLNPDAGWGRKSDVLWGFDLAGQYRDTLVICEGPFDAIAVWSKANLPAVAVLGCEISVMQARLIDHLQPKRAVVLFDGDACMKAKGSAYRLRHVCRPSIEVRYVQWPQDLVKEDPDTVRAETLWELLDQWWEEVR